MTDRNPNLLRKLQSLEGDRGALAALRKYWSPATRHQAYPVLGQLGALDDNRKAIVAALYAEHPLHQNGSTIGQAALRLGDRKDGDHPYDRHFRRLLACQELGETSSPGDLAQQLHRLVKRLKRDGIGLDYAELLKNLNFWSGYRDRVVLRWAADFWRSPLPETPTPSES